MPPKYKPGGKRFPPKIIPKPVPQQSQQTGSSTPTATSSSMDCETENKFELELCWCIQQLEISINSKKLGDKQMRDAQKSLKLLKSNNCALIKKRQNMRSTFGDYRAKMAEEEKKHKKNTVTAKICASKPNESKSVFLRKHNKDLAQVETKNLHVEINGKHCKSQLAELFKQTQAEESFKFNFNEPTTHHAN